MKTFQIPRFTVALQIALIRARMIARSNFRLAVERLRAAGVMLESAIAIVARFVGAAVAARQVQA